MAALWSSQPYKTVYTVFFLLKTPPHLALLFLLYLFKPFRRLEEWSARQNLVSAAVEMFLGFVLATRCQAVLCTDPEDMKERHSRVDPPPEHLFTGVLEGSKHEAVMPAPVDAIWFPSPAPRDLAELKKQRVVLHFPGGAYFIALNHNYFGWIVADAMAKHMKATRTVWAPYRLTGTPGTCFPAALQDAITFYHHLLSLGIEPCNIILSGDSAGGNLVIALLRHLESLPLPSLPLPGGTMVFSPWTNLTAHTGHDYDESKNSRADVFQGHMLQTAVDLFSPRGEIPKDKAPYISPLHHPFKLSTPLFIHAGAAEGFFDDIKCFAQEMAQINGERVRFEATPLAPHDILISHQAFGMTESLNAAVDKAFEFLDHGD